MSENTEIWNLNALCRCCHKDGHFKCLQDSFIYENEVEVYAQMLRDTFDIEIQQPLLEASTSICEACILRLRDACQFKKQVLICERKFEVYCKNELATADAVEEPIKAELDFDDDFDSGCNDKELEIETDFPKKEEDFENDVKNIKSEVPEENKSYIQVKLPLEIKSDSTEKVQKKRKKIKKKKVTRRKKLGYDPSLEVQVQTESGLVYSCKLCSTKFSCHKDIKNHILTTHKYMYPCRLCDETFASQWQKTVHMRSHTGLFNCSYCDKKYNTAYSLKAHINTHTKSENFICDICSKGFAYKNTLNVHMRGHYGTKKKCVCHICGRGFNDRTNLRIHISTVHEKNRPFACELCPKTFTAKKHLVVHIRGHTGELPFECGDCPKKFATKTQLNIHFQSAHVNNGEQYVCKVCRKRWVDKRLFLRHVRKAHVGNRPYKCTVCEKDFTCKYSMKRHVDQHDGIKAYRCEQCDAKFAQKNSLSRHVERKHAPKDAPEIRDKCELCNKSVADLKKHMLCHTNKRFSCELCGKSYSENNVLTRHKREVHMGLKRHYCQFCDKKYIKVSTLRNHQMKVHKVVSKVEDDEDFDSAVAKFSIKNKKGRIKTEIGGEDTPF